MDISYGTQSPEPITDALSLPLLNAADSDSLFDSPIINTLPYAGIAGADVHGQLEAVSLPLTTSLLPLADTTEQCDSLPPPPSLTQSVSSSSYDTDRIKEVTVKVLNGKEEKTFVLRDVHVREMASVDSLKKCLESALPDVTVGDIGYFQKWKKVWIQSQLDLQTIVKEHLFKGKGALWCSVAKSPAVVDLEHHSANGCGSVDAPSKPTQAKKKKLIEEKRERVQEIFEELKTRHKSNYNAPQYRLWAEAINIGQHVSRETPPLGTMFQRCGVPVQGRSSKNELSEAFTALAKTVTNAIAGKQTPPNQSPPREHSITPAKAAALKTTYINQIKDLHSLLESGAITESDYQKQRDVVLAQMANL